LTRFDELRKQRFENLNQLANTSIDQHPSELAPFLAPGFWLLASGFWLLASDFRLQTSHFTLQTSDL